MKHKIVLKKFVVNRISKMLACATMAASCADCHTTPKTPGSIGAIAPAYAAPSLAGDSVRLADLHGSVVLLNVWATWCIPCRREIPELQALHQQFSGRGLRVIGVSVDDAATAGDVADFVRDFGMTYTVLRDPANRISDLFRLHGVPGSFLIDRQGIVRWRRLGAIRAGDKEFAAVLEKTLGAGAKL